MSSRPLALKPLQRSLFMSRHTDRARRKVIAGLGALALPAFTPAWAHHGWSSFDQDQPIYLEGIARQVRWRNPHAELILEVDPSLKLPADFAQRAMPSQSAPVDAARLLATTRLPARSAARWEIELAPLFRMSQWQVPEIRDGERVAAVGFGLREQPSTPLMRVEYLFVQGRVYGMRSSPA
jgi:hypothetical protein